MPIKRPLRSRPKIPSRIFPPVCCASAAKDFAAAEAEYKQVLALDPQSSEAVIGLTNIYMKSGRLAEAEPLLRRLANDRPDDAGLHLQLGRVLAAQGKKDDAIAEIQARSNSRPTTPRRSAISPTC